MEGRACCAAAPAAANAAAGAGVVPLVVFTSADGICVCGNLFTSLYCFCLLLVSCTEDMGDKVRYI